MAQGYFIEVRNPRAKHGPFSTMKKARAFAQRIADKLGKSVKIVFGAKKAKRAASRRKNSPDTFVTGFRDACKRWDGGETFAQLYRAFKGSTDYDAGGTAAVYALEGTPDHARRHARAFGLTPAQADRLVADVERHSPSGYVYKENGARSNPTSALLWSGVGKRYGWRIYQETVGTGANSGLNAFVMFAHTKPPRGFKGTTWSAIRPGDAAWSSVPRDVQEKYHDAIRNLTIARQGGNFNSYVDGTTDAHGGLRKRGSRRPNPARGPRGEIDEQLANDLVLSIENYGELHGQFNSIRLNLLKKMKKGKYDHAKAPKLFRYLVDRGAQIYAKDGGLPKNSINVPTRDAAARQLADSFAEQAKSGEYDHLLTAGNDAFAWGPQRSNPLAKGGRSIAKDANEHQVDEIIMVIDNEHDLYDLRNAVYRAFLDGKAQPHAQLFAGLINLAIARDTNNGSDILRRVSKATKAAAAKEMLDRYYTKVEVGEIDYLRTKHNPVLAVTNTRRKSLTPDMKATFDEAVDYFKKMRSRDAARIVVAGIANHSSLKKRISKSLLEEVLTVSGSTFHIGRPERKSNPGHTLSGKPVEDRAWTPNDFQHHHADWSAEELYRAQELHEREAEAGAKARKAAKKSKNADALARAEQKEGYHTYMAQAFKWARKGDWLAAREEVRSAVGEMSYADAEAHPSRANPRPAGGEFRFTYREGQPRVWEPDVRVKKLSASMTVEPLAGDASQLGVFEGDRCIGWIDTRDLGYEGVKDWIAATGWQQKGGARANPHVGSAKGDKAVIRAFTEQKPASSKKLHTDGHRLDGLWMGGSGIAEWSNGKIVFHDLGSKSAQRVQKMIRKEAPKNDLAEGWTRGSKKNPGDFQIGDMAMWAHKKVLIVDSHGYGATRTVDVRWTVSGGSGSHDEVSGHKRGVPVAELSPVGSKKNSAAPRAKTKRQPGAYAQFVKRSMPKFKHLAPKARMSAIAAEWRAHKAQIH